MRIHYGGANPSANRGCTKHLTRNIVLKGNKKVASALSQLWVLSHVSVIIPERPHWAIRSTKI